MNKFRRYVIYLISLFIISLCASLSIKANLGTSPLICIPYVLSLITNLSVGTTSFLFSILVIAVQVILLRGGFEKRQYLQIVIGTIFSVFVDLTMMMINFGQMTGELKILLDRLYGVTHNPLIPLSGKFALIFTHLGPEGYYDSYIELTKIQPFQMNMHYEIVDVLVAGSLGDIRNQPEKFAEAFEIGKKF